MTGLTSALAGFAAGTLVLQWQAELPRVAEWLLAALLLAAAAGWCGTRRSMLLRSVLRVALIALAAAALGFAIAASRAESRLADALPPEWEDRPIDVIGVVDDLPHASPRGTRFALRTERVITPGARVPARLSLAWFPVQRADAAPVPHLRPGERWRLRVRLKRPHGNVNPHGFDLEAWLLENEFRATGYVRTEGDNARLHAFVGAPLDYVQRARENIRDRIVAALPDGAYAGVIVALTIGEQRAIPESQWLVFNRTGITHLISISGLHVTVFAALAAGVAYRLARRSVRLTSVVAAHRIAAAAGALAAFAYVMLAGAQIPALRTLIMVIVAAIGLWLARPGTARLVWLWALVAVLAFDPWAGLTPGFWLSFGAVALLLYAGAARLASAPRSFMDARLRALRVAAHAQAVVTLGLVPLTLVVFQQVSLIAPVANALAIPVVTFIVVPIALVAIVVPFAAPWQAAHGVFALLMVPLEWLTALPGAVWQQHAPLPWTVVASLLGVVWMLAPPGIPLRALGFFWLLPLFLVLPPKVAHGSVRVVTLDVGQGLAVLVQTATHSLLYDTGPRFSDDADAGGRIVAPFLRAIGARRLSMLIVSHLDADHSGGARTLAHTVPIESVSSSVRYDDPMWQGLAARVTRCRAGERWVWDEVVFTVLHPPPQWYGVARMKTNDLSCVMRIATAGAAVLLTGDAEARSEVAMLDDAAALRAAVIIVPHHGARTSSTPPFIAAVGPDVAVFAAGYRNRFGHPREDIVERYAAVGAELLRTDLQGAITVEISASGVVSVVAERERARRYWYDAPWPE